MWQPILDCGKQLTIYSRLRQKADAGYKLYEISEVEFDQYQLQLLSQNDMPAEDIRQVISCEQLVEYGFEVEVEE